MNVLISIFKIYERNKKFKNIFNQINQLSVFVENLIIKYNSFKGFVLESKVIYQFSVLIGIPYENILIKSLNEILKNTKSNKYQSIRILDCLYVLLINKKPTKSFIYENLINTRLIDKAIFVLLEKKDYNNSKFENLLFVPYLIENLSSKTWNNLFSKIISDKSTNYLSIYKRIINQIPDNKRKAYEKKLKFFSLKILIEKKNKITKNIFISELLKNLFLIDKKIIKKESMQNETSLSQLIKQIEVDDAKNKILKKSDSKNNLNKTKELNRVLDSINILAKNKLYETSFETNNFEFLLNLKNETKIPHYKFNFSKNLDQILSSKKNFINFIEHNFYDQDLFFSFVELSLSNDNKKIFSQIFNKIDKKLIKFEQGFIIINDKFSIVNIDKKGYSIILRSYLLKIILADKFRTISTQEFSLGFLYYLFDSMKLSLKKLSKINYKSNNKIDDSKDIHSRGLNKDEYLKILKVFDIFLEKNNFSSITSTEKEKIYFKDLSYYLIANSSYPFWSKIKKFTLDEAFQYFDNSILKRDNINFEYLFYNKVLFKNIQDYVINKDYDYNQKLIKSIKGSINKSKIYGAKEIFEEVRLIKDQNLFFQKLNFSIYKQQSKFETHIHLDSYYVLTYFMEFGSFEPFQNNLTIDNFYQRFKSSIKKSKLKIKKLIYNSGNNRKKISRLISIFPAGQKEEFLDLIHPFLNKKINLIAKVSRYIYDVDFIKEAGFDDITKLYEFITFHWSRSNYIIYDEDKLIVEILNKFFIKFKLPSQVFFDDINNTDYKLSDEERLIFDKIFLKHNLIFKEAAKPKIETTNSFANTDEYSIAIKNAGLILLWPYLFTLYEKLDFIENKNFKDDEFRQRAILLSQYLIEKKLEFHENDLVLNKIILGVDLDYSIDCSLKIHDHEIELCESLIKSVLNHWKKMENTSVETFRSTFLMRDAVLNKDENSNYILHVDKKPYDLLLSSIPWNIKSVQTIFMKNKIIIDWAKND